MRRADEALYRAKSAGKNRVVAAQSGSPESSSEASAGESSR